MLLSTQSSNWICTVNWSRASPRSINLTDSIRASCAGVTFTCVFPSGSVVFWLTSFHSVNQNTTDPLGYTLAYSPHHRIFTWNSYYCTIFSSNFFHISYGIWNHIALPISGIRNLQRNMEFALFHIPLQRTGKPILAEKGTKSKLHLKIRWSQGIR